MSAPETNAFAIDISQGGQKAGITIAGIAVKISEPFAPEEQIELLAALLGGITCHIYQQFGGDVLQRVLAGVNEAWRQFDAANRRGTH